MTEETPTGQSDHAATLATRLRAEHAAQAERGTQALLLHECGVLEETRGEEPVAARDYLAAFNADPQFREPLESLVRILSRRKSLKSLGKLLDALTRAAVTSEERVRAHWEKAAYHQDFDKNFAAAKESLEEAIAANPEDCASWLELELISARESDADGRMRSLEARAELSGDATWKALLLIDLAGMQAQAGNADRAYEMLGTAAALEGKARFRTQVALEAIAQRDDNLDALSRALEGQADLLVEAIEDAERGDETGVPRHMRKAEFAADAWLRLGEVKRRQGDANGWSSCLQRAAELFPDSAVIARARISALESIGEIDTAADLAKQELRRLGAITDGEDGTAAAVQSPPGAAGLWLRVADAARMSNDRAGALDALRRAIAADGESIPARALELDLLASGEDAAALAQALEVAAEGFPSEEAKGRAFVLAAYVWGCQANEAGAAKAALSQAAVCGVEQGTISRLGRAIAAMRSDGAWYEEATKRLLAAGSDAAEHPSLWFELGRSKLLRGDEAGARDAFGKLAACGGTDGTPGPSAWIGRVLGSYAIEIATRASEADGTPKPVRPAAEAIEDLARVETDTSIARGFWLVAAFRRARLGDIAGARVLLQDLHDVAAGDEVIAVFLAELSRRGGDSNAAANALGACAAASEDGALAAALHLEAATLRWRAGDRAQAIHEMEAARAQAPRAASAFLSWALRGVDNDTLEGRRRALEAASEAGVDPVAIALERFGLEAGSHEGDSVEALAALETLENDGSADFEAAAALGRLIWGPALEQRGLVDRALDRLEERGGDAIKIARAERFRLARTIDQDRSQAVATAAAWSQAEPELYASLEWLGAAIAAEDREAEITARRAVAEHMSGDARAAMEASATAVAMLDQPHAPQRFIQGDVPAARLMNLEIAGAGCDPRRRSAALHSLGDTLGDDAQLDAIGLAGWSELCAGEYEKALGSFKTVVENRADDIVAWEGMRSSAEALGDHVQTALACAQLGNLCAEDQRGAGFWEQAGMILLEKTEAQDDAEIAFDRAFERDPKRAVAFDKLFRRVRARNEDDRLLTIINRRLDVVEDEQETLKLFWERARVLRKKGDVDAALAALEDVTMLEPDHVGALALAGEIQISKQAFDKAAPLLARLSQVADAPKQQRLMSGVAAADLYEGKLQKADKALEVLVGMHKSGLSTLPIRERLAKVAAKVGSWEQATAILEQLMRERDRREGRIEAARLAMAIYTDKLRKPLRAEAAVSKLLEEAPDDGEAVDLVLTTGFDAQFRSRALGRAKSTIVQALAQNPCDADRVSLLTKIAGAGQDVTLRQATLGALVSLGREDAGLSDELARIDAQVTARPQITLDAAALSEIADPDDHGPIAEMFVALAETVGLALGPSLASLGVTKKERIDPRGAPPIRVAIAEWTGALGLTEWELYVGGTDPNAVNGVAGEIPTIVVGANIKTPLTPAARSAIAREVFALRRGITSLRHRDDNTVASLVVAACQEAGIQMPNPTYAIFGEVQRAVRKEMSRKVRKVLPDTAQRVASGKQDAVAWAQAARRSIDRMAVIAAGDVSLVLSDVLAVPREKLGARVSGNDRAKRLLGFVLSPSYLELRKKLGMGVR
jgi:tetratricopeptide (TPR) repeat protein